MGRPRLSSPERRRRVLASKAKWRDANREYYREQKNRLSSRPEYKERRKELRAQAKARMKLDEAQDRGWDEGLQRNDAVGGLVLVPEDIDSSDEERFGVFIPPGYDLMMYAPPQTNDSGASASDEEAGGVAGL